MMGASDLRDTYITITEDQNQEMLDDSKSIFESMLDTINYPEFLSSYYLPDGSLYYKSKMTLICSIPALLFLILSLYILILPLFSSEVISTELQLKFIDEYIELPDRNKQITVSEKFRNLFLERKFFTHSGFHP